MCRIRPGKSDLFPTLKRKTTSSTINLTILFYLLCLPLSIVPALLYLLIEGLWVSGESRPDVRAPLISENLFIAGENALNGLRCNVFGLYLGGVDSSSHVSVY